MAAEPGWSQWSDNLEQAWRGRITGDQGPRISIRPDPVGDTGAADEFSTRPLESGEQEEIAAFVPDTSKHRRIVTFDPAEPTPGMREAQELELQGELARGGMGIVYRGRQVSLDREVAVKRLKPNDKLPDAVGQFESEACITAVLDHPNIVPVYDLGVDQRGNLFYSMKLVSGTPWDDLLHERPPMAVAAGPDGRDLRAHLEVLLEVANAVAFAHSRGIIHRDIKPQNVIVGEYGEVLLVDWGLGAALRKTPGDRIADLDEVLITCGTPAYMAPEIALGLREWVGTRTDVYMLGAVLYELLYGMVPHDESTAIDAVKVASDNEWAFPGEIPQDLRAYHEVLKPIMSRALATQPAERQADAGEFVHELKDALRHLDSAGLAAEAIALFQQAEREETAAQQVRHAAGASINAMGTVENRYRMLARSIAGLEQALSSWADNAEARHYLVEAHLLQAHASIVAGDITQAESHVQSLDALPHGIALSAEQQGKRASLRRRIDERRAARTSRKRWSRIFTVSAVVLAVALVAGATLAAFLIGRARDRVTVERNHLSRLLIASASEGIDAELRRIFEPVTGTLRNTHDWIRAGRLDSDDPDELARFFIPIVDGYPVISSIMRADTAGHEFLLLRDEGGWMWRLTVPGQDSRFAKLDAQGLVLETWEEAVEYDASTRPWFQGAQTLREAKTRGEAGGDAIFWTEPYTFFTRKEPGITASMPVASSSGRQYVIGVDVPLSGLSTYTMAMNDSELGKVFVLSDDDRVVALPRSERFVGAQARREASLSPVDEIGEPVVAAAAAKWRERGDGSDEAFRFEAEGQPWWAGFRSFPLAGDRTFYIGVVLPESDFAAADAD